MQYIIIFFLLYLYFYFLLIFLFSIFIFFPPLKFLYLNRLNFESLSRVITIFTMLKHFFPIFQNQLHSYNKEKK